MPTQVSASVYAHATYLTRSVPRLSSQLIILNMQEWEGARIAHSQEHCIDQVTGFPAGNSSSYLSLPLSCPPVILLATIFGNNFLLLQHFLISKLLLDEVILPSC